MACTPVVIPPQPPLTVFGDVVSGPVTWCDTTMTLALFVEYININLQIIVDCFEETFQEVIQLPGVPPITIGSPGLRIPGMDPFTGERVSRAELSGFAHTGHRFPWQTGGEARTPWEFRGFPAVNVPGGSVTIPGTDPMRVVMDITRVNYHIIVERLEERGLEPILDWSQFDRGCDIPPDLNPNNQAVNDIIPPADSIDGAPLPNSEVPTFGPGSGGPGSCWAITNGQLRQRADGTWEVAIVPGGAAPSVELSCICAPEGGGDFDFGATYTISDGDGLGGLGFGCGSMIAKAGSAADCSDFAALQNGGSIYQTLDGSEVSRTMGLQGITTPAGSSLGITISARPDTPGGDVAFSAPFITLAGASGPLSGTLCDGSVSLRDY